MTPSGRWHAHVAATGIAGIEQRLRSPWRLSWRELAGSMEVFALDQRNSDNSLADHRNGTSPRPRGVGSSPVDEGLKRSESGEVFLDSGSLTVALASFLGCPSARRHAWVLRALWSSKPTQLLKTQVRALLPDTIGAVSRAGFRFLGFAIHRRPNSILLGGVRDWGPEFFSLRLPTCAVHRRMDGCAVFPDRISGRQSIPKGKPSFR